MGQRSPNFPVISLKDAVERARMLYEKDGTGGSTKDSVFKNMGYNSKNGASLGVLSALGKFGLTDEKNGRIVLTKDAIFILMKGGNEDQRRDALRRCALRPVLYKKLWEDHAEHGALPGDDTLRSLLVSMDFNPKSVNKAVEAFRETIAFADLRYEQGADEKPDDSNNGNGSGSGNEAMNLSTPKLEDRSPQVRDYAIPRKGQKVAILRLEYPVSAEDVEQIEKWLELMKGTISED